MKIKLPTKKELNGLRFGQEVFNALAHRYETTDKETLMDMLYELDGDEIAYLIEEYKNNTTL